MKLLILFILVLRGLLTVCVAQQADISPDLKVTALKDAACTKPDEGQDPTVTTAMIHAGGRDAGTIVQIAGACHCEQTNCDALVYLRSGDGYKLALHEKYASLHTMKIVKLGMPSLTGKFEINASKMETTVYDWDGKTYRPSLCATVIKGKKVPSITRHPCRQAAP